MKEGTGGRKMRRVWSDGKPRLPSIEWSPSLSRGKGESGSERSLEPFFGKFENNVIGLDILKMCVTNKEREVGESCSTSMGRPEVNKGCWELRCILGVTWEKYSLEKRVGDLYYSPFENHRKKPEASGGILKGFKLPFLPPTHKAPNSLDKAPDS